LLVESEPRDGFRWEARLDDIQLLRLINDLELNDSGALFSGLSLLQRAAKAAGGKVLDIQRDYGPFARELVLARDRGYLEFKERPMYGSPMYDPDHDPNMWLQHIQEIRLTLDGRDRATGRLILGPLPDPDEDDGRDIAGMTLEEIARAIGNTYTGPQLLRFLRQSGIPSEYAPAQVTGNKWEYVLSVLESLHEGGGEARRSLRTFIGRWLINLLHTWPDEDVRRRIETQLGQQGWHVRDGRLVVGEVQAATEAPPPPASLEAQIQSLHPDIRQVAERFITTHPEVAIFEALKAVNKRVKEMSKLDADGSDLMGKAFRDADPTIRLANLSTEPGKDIQAGFRFLFMGAVRGIRNPDAHELFKPLDDQEVMERLGLASMLMRRLDDAVTG
jgi:uncharacterized protein (TIGR02391 family)